MTFKIIQIQMVHIIQIWMISSQIQTTLTNHPHFEDFVWITNHRSRTYVEELATCIHEKRDTAFVNTFFKITKMSASATSSISIMMHLVLSTKKLNTDGRWSQHTHCSPSMNKSHCYELAKPKIYIILFNYMCAFVSFDLNKYIA